MNKAQRRKVIKYQNKTGTKCKHQALAAVLKAEQKDEDRA